MENVVNIGVRSALLSRCLKKGFSSVVYRISTLAVGSRAHRSFKKRFIRRKKNIFRNKKKIGVRSALLSRCLKKGFSSVVYRIFTLAVCSRAQRSFSKRGSAVEKRILGGEHDFKFHSRWLKLFQMGSIIKFKLQKTIASPPPEIPKKKVLVLRWDLLSATNIGFDRTICCIW